MMQNFRYIYQTLFVMKIRLTAKNVVILNHWGKTMLIMASSLKRYIKVKVLTVGIYFKGAFTNLSWGPYGK